MPISGPSSYLSTTDEFIAHWSSLNTDLGANGPFVLPRQVTLNVLAGWRGALEGQQALVEGSRNNRELARADIETKKAALLLRLNQFNAKLESLLPEQRWLDARPRAFTVTEGMGKVLPPLDDAADLWTKYDSEVDGFNLAGNYPLADFVADLALFKTLYPAYASADNSLKLARGKRNVTQEKIYAILKNYRQCVIADFLEGDPLRETLPRLTPLPGHTPQAVNVAGTWSAASQQAELTWTASTDEALDHYELRGVVGPDYEGDDEQVLASFAPGAARAWSGLYGLTAPGMAASFKVYVVLNTGNESGSAVVTVTRSP